MPLFRTILVAADFSEGTRQAFRVACSLAREDKTRLIVLHVAGPSIASGEPGVPSVIAGGDRAHHEALRERLRADYVPDRPLEVEFSLGEGDPTEAILRVAEGCGCDLVVMGTHGRTGLGRLLAGSVAEAVLRKARCPVLALRSPDRRAAPSALRGRAAPAPGSSPAPSGQAPRWRQRPALPPIRTVLHPTDFSDCSKAALRVARALARDLGARLIILHVAPRESNLGKIPALTDLPACGEALGIMRELLEDSDLKCDVETRLRIGHAAAEILDAAEELQCDLIVVGAHGRTGPGRLLMGSVAEAVLRGARCPILMVKTPVPDPPALVAAPDPPTVS
jgi:nucleotide-binding universal stress UspA family protein